MKTKELIKELQEADPTGEEEVCVGNISINFVEKLPAYYDGPLQVITKDENSKFLNAKYKRTGSKVNIHTKSITDLLVDHPDINIDYSELNEISAKNTLDAHNKLRAFYRKIEMELELENFINWVKINAQKVTSDIDLDELESQAKLFFEKTNINSEDPLPENFCALNESYVTLRKMQWDERFKVYIDNGFIKINKK